MKKLILGISLACFVAFGTLSIQSVVAATANPEYIQMDPDDDPDKNKKTEATAKDDGKDKKDAKANGKTACKPGGSDCKSAAAKSAPKSKCCASKSGSSECKGKDGDKK